MAASQHVIMQNIEYNNSYKLRKTKRNITNVNDIIKRNMSTLIIMYAINKKHITKIKINRYKLNYKIKLCGFGYSII